MGKSRLAKSLARELCGIHLETDCYLEAGELDRKKLLNNFKRYAETGLHVLIDGIRLEERCPRAEFGQGFSIIVQALFVSGNDRVDAEARAAELGTDGYFQDQKPHLRADALIKVTVTDGHEALIGAMNEIDP